MSYYDPNITIVPKPTDSFTVTAKPSYPSTTIVAKPSTSSTTIVAKPSTSSTPVGQPADPMVLLAEDGVELMSEDLYVLIREF